MFWKKFSHAQTHKKHMRFSNLKFHVFKKLQSNKWFYVWFCRRNISNTEDRFLRNCIFWHTFFFFKSLYLKVKNWNAHQTRTRKRHHDLWFNLKFNHSNLHGSRFRGVQNYSKKNIQTLFSNTVSIIKNIIDFQIAFSISIHYDFICVP